MARSDKSGLPWRVASTAVLLPLTLGIVWLGSWPFVVLAGALGGVMYWEWQGFCKTDPPQMHVSRLLGIVGCAAGPFLAPLLTAQETASAWAALSVAYFGLLAIDRRPHAAFLGAGFAFILAGLLLMVWIRALPDDGRATLIWIVLLVTATDTGAYFTGRTVGGPKLASRISPKKTWAGLFGGMALAGLVGVAVAVALGLENIIGLALVSAGLAVVAQIGDLTVSKAKRTFGIKDSSDLIPGHGGFLDRLDGYLTVVPTVALISWLAGASPLSWL